MENPDAYLGRLRPIYIFKGLSDEEIKEAAAELQVEQVKAGETIFAQGAEGQDFYIINKGQARVLRQRHNRAPEEVATLVENTSSPRSAWATRIFRASVLFMTEVTSL